MIRIDNITVLKWYLDYGCHCILVDEKYNISDLLPFSMDLMDFNSERNAIF